MTFLTASCSWRNVERSTNAAVAQDGGEWTGESVLWEGLGRDARLKTWTKQPPKMWAQLKAVSLEWMRSRAQKLVIRPETCDNIPVSTRGSEFSRGCHKTLFPPLPESADLQSITLKAGRIRFLCCRCSPWRRCGCSCRCKGQNVLCVAPWHGAINNY